MTDDNSTSITVYTTEPCAFCTRAKALLETRGYGFEEVNLARDPAGRADLVDKTGQMTFPQVVVGERPVGGFDELAAADRAGTLADLLAA